MNHDDQSSSDVQEAKENIPQSIDVEKSNTASCLDQSSSESLLVVSGNRRRSDADNQDEPDSTDQKSTTKRPISPVQDEETCDSFNKKTRLESVDSTEGRETKENEVVLETPQLSTGEIKKKMSLMKPNQNLYQNQSLLLKKKSHAQQR